MDNVVENDNNVESLLSQRCRCYKRHNSWVGQLTISPFAALASLMLVVLVSAFLFLLGNLFQAIIGGDTDPKES